MLSLHSCPLIIIKNLLFVFHVWHVTLLVLEVAFIPIYYLCFSTNLLPVLWIVTFFVFIASLNWKIIYSEKGFLFRSIFHRTIFFTYSQIDRIIFTKSEYILTIQKRKIRVPMFAENSDDFLSYLKKVSDE